MSTIGTEKELVILCTSPDVRCTHHCIVLMLLLLLLLLLVCRCHGDDDAVAPQCSVNESSLND